MVFVGTFIASHTICMGITRDKCSCGHLYALLHTRRDQSAKPSPSGIIHSSNFNPRSDRGGEAAAKQKLLRFAGAFFGKRTAFVN